MSSHEQLEELRIPLNELKRRFFLTSESETDFKATIQKSLDLILDYYLHSPDSPVYPVSNIDEILPDYTSIEIPDSINENLDTIHEDLKRILKDSVRVGHERYMGHMTMAIPYFAIALDMIVSSINQNQVKLETAFSSTLVERQSLLWMHRMFYNLNEDFYKSYSKDLNMVIGNITTGGTTGNLTALAVAREKAFPGSQKRGYAKALKESGHDDAVILTSRRAHYSIKKSAGLLGLGHQGVVEIPVDRSNRIRTDLLSEMIEELTRQNIKVIAVAAMAGTTETGSIDDLESIADICQKYNIWFHVDAAWGGAMILGRDTRSMLKGIERSDSIIFDGHKLFFLPLALGAVLFRDRDSAFLFEHSADYIIRKESADLGRTTVEGSRRFNSLKLYYAIRALGREGYELLLKRSLLLTSIMKDLIKEDEDFELTSEPELCMLTYRFAPTGFRKEIEDARKRGDENFIRKQNDRLNHLNIHLQKRQKKAGKSFVSRTILESTGYDEPIVVLRAIFANILTETNMLREMLDEQREIGRQLLKEQG